MTEFVNILRAFEKVWHLELISKQLLTYLCNKILSFNTNQNSQIRINTDLSQVQQINATEQESLRDQSPRTNFI